MIRDYWLWSRDEATCNNQTLLVRHSRWLPSPLPRPRPEFACRGCQSSATCFCWERIWWANKKGHPLKPKDCLTTSTHTCCSCGCRIVGDRSQLEHLLRWSNYSKFSVLSIWGQDPRNRCTGVTGCHSVYICQVRILASPALIVLMWIRYELALRQGLPFGALFSGLQISQASYLWSMKFWETACSKHLPVRRRIDIILIIFKELWSWKWIQFPQASSDTPDQQLQATFRSLGDHHFERCPSVMPFSETSLMENRILFSTQNSHLHSTPQLSTLWRPLGFYGVSLWRMQAQRVMD